MMKELQCIAQINNIPDEFEGTGGKSFMVVRLLDAKLWYYGVYDTPEKALQAALEIGNGLVLEV